MSEYTQVVKPIQRALNALEECKCFNVHGNAFIEVGTPDIVGCYRGKTFVFECKLPGEKPTKIQSYRLQEWGESGAITAVVCNVEDAIRALTLY